MRRIFILTLSWNGLTKLTSLKNTLIPCLDNLDWQWIIKDNGSTDNTFEIASKWHPKIKVINYPNNIQNFSAGTNYCLNYANPNDEDLVLLLNNDIVFKDSSSIKNMISLMKDDVGAVGCKMLYTNSDKIQHVGVVFDRNKLPYHLYRGRDLKKINLSNNEFQAVTGACMLTKAKYIRSSNNGKGFDESYFWCFEYVDFCLDLKYKQNKKVLCCNDTNIFHEESATLKKNPIQKMFFQQNVVKFLTKWFKTISVDENIYPNLS
jgi:GT2 family glycosyltransferase